MYDLDLALLKLVQVFHSAQILSENSSLSAAQVGKLVGYKRAGVLLRLSAERRWIEGSCTVRYRATRERFFGLQVVHGARAKK